MSRSTGPDQAATPVPTVRPDWPRWEQALDDAVAAGAPAVRLYPPQWGLGAGDPRLRAVTAACGARGLVVLLTVRFEDLRQRGLRRAAGFSWAASAQTLLAELEAAARTGRAAHASPRA